MMPNNPYGYGASTPEQLLNYLTREVNSQCFASDEDLYAAQYIESLEQHISVLQKELLKYKQLYEEAQHEFDRDTARLNFCLQEGAILEDDMIHLSMDHEVVEQDDLRAAIDRLMP